MLRTCLARRRYGKLWIKGDSTTASLLLERGAAVDLVDKTKTSPLMQAMMRGNEEMVQILLEWYADTNIVNDIGESPLMVAARSDLGGIMKLLIEHGAGIDVQDDSGKTALMHAAIAGHVNTVHVLLDEIADMSLQSNEGLTALDYAKQQKNSAIAVLLETTHHGREEIESSLLKYVAEGDVKMVEAAVKLDANIEVRDGDGNTPLLVAVTHNHEEVLKLLLESIADVNAQNAVGRTALSIASEKNQSATAWTLRKCRLGRFERMHGADVRI